MAGAEAALLWTALGMVALRAAGLLLAGALRPEHPLIAWAAAVSQATLAAFVVLAVVAPTGVAALVPWPARVAGLLAGLVAWRLLGGRVLWGLLAGLAVLVGVRAGLG